jgi:hypothetical protein
LDGPEEKAGRLFQNVPLGYNRRNLMQAAGEAARRLVKTFERAPRSCGIEIAFDFIG